MIKVQASKNARHFIVMLCVLLSSIACKKKVKNTNKDSESNKYNILFIIVDDLRPLLGSYGANYIYSPNIDSLARKGLRFDNAFAQAPICSPSRMSFLTGLRPHQSQLTGNNMQLRDKLPTIQTLPQLFKEQGYQTRAHGKVFHQGNGDSISWHYYDDSPKQRSTYHLRENISINDAYSKTKRGRPFEAADVHDSLYTDGIIANRAVRELDSFSSNEPFFLAVGLLKPHLPFNAPKKYWDLYSHSFKNYPVVNKKPKNIPPLAFQNSGELRRYYTVPKNGSLKQSLKDSLTQGYMACVSYADAQIGRLLSGLKQNNYTNNTIVVVIGDHGYHLGDFEDWCKNTQYKMDARVPLIIYHPDKPSQIITQTVELVDLYPTLIDLAGLSKPKHELSGQSLAKLFDDGNYLLEKNYALTENKRKHHLGFGLTQGNYRLIEWRKRKNIDEIDEVELYDYQNTYYEKINVAQEKAYDSILNIMQLKMNKILSDL